MTEVNPIELTNQMIEAFEAVQKAFKEADAEEKYCNLEYNDLTHALELTNFGTVDGYRLAKQIKDNRLRRRQAKDLQEQLEPLLTLMNKNQNFFRELKNVQAEIQQT